jgi:hypothetical protein
MLMFDLPDLLDAVATVLFDIHSNLHVVLLNLVKLIAVGLLCFFDFLLQLCNVRSVLFLFFLCWCEPLL